MTVTAFILIIFSVVLHVGWNFLCKANKKPTLAFYFIANLIAGIVLLPLLFMADVDWTSMGWKFWMLVFFSDFFEMIYAVGLFKAYGRNDISLVYPMARALPVLMIPIVTLSFSIGAPPAGWALAGMAIVAVGCMIMPQAKLSGLNWRILVSRSMIPILIAAVGTTGYTLMDNMATKDIVAPGASRIVTLGAYLCIVQFGIALFLFIYMKIAGREGWNEIRDNIKMPGPYLCGVFSFAAYFLVLGAMGFVSNVSYLQAFRQMSLPLGVFAGWFFLKERLTLPKIVGTVFVVTGLILTVIK